VGVDHRDLAVLLAEKLSHSSDVISVFEQMGSQGMPERVTGRVLEDSGLVDCCRDRLLQDSFVNVARPASPVCGFAHRLF